MLRESLTSALAGSWSALWGMPGWVYAGLGGLALTRVRGWAVLVHKLGVMR